MFKAPVLLNIGFSTDTMHNESKSYESSGGDLAFDYYIDKEFDINSFCKSVGQRLTRNRTFTTCRWL